MKKAFWTSHFKILAKTLILLHMCFDFTCVPPGFTAVQNLARKHLRSTYNLLEIAVVHKKISGGWKR